MQTVRASGAISETEVIVQIWTLLIGSFVVAYGLDRWLDHDFPSVLSIAAFGAIISYIYSAPPLKLKQSGWIGNYALGSSNSLDWLMSILSGAVCRLEAIDCLRRWEVGFRLEEALRPHSAFTTICIADDDAEWNFILLNFYCIFMPRHIRASSPQSE